MSQPVLDVNQIKQILPHRYPFLMIDRVIELDSGKRAVGIKNVTHNEEYFNGHFPGNPVMPGVLQVEALAQLAGIMMGSASEKKDVLVLFGGADAIRWRRQVVPGDTLRLEVDLIKAKGPIVKAKGQAFVGSELACEAEITLAIDRNKKPSTSPAVSSVSSSLIHPTAVIDPSVKLGHQVSIGAYVTIKANVEIGDNTIIDDHVVIKENSLIGKENHIHYGAIIGDLPQDIKFGGEQSGVKIGDRNHIREYVTINRATGEGNYTTIGNDNLIMSQVHLAHNVVLGNEISIVSLSQIAGHVEIEDQAILGGMVGIPQFIRIGRLAMIGGYSKPYQDIPPFMICDGNPAEVSGVNVIGLKRRKAEPAVVDQVKKAYKLLYRSKLNTSQAVDQIKKECAKNGALVPEVEHLLHFIEQSKKGINRKIDDEESQQNAFLGLGNAESFFDRMKGILTRRKS